jgi:hypothetical protein
MAYNITNDEVKKTQQTMLDKDTEQHIGGRKVFIGGIEAESFKFLTGEELKRPAIETINNDAAGRILISNGNKTATGTPHLEYKKGMLLCHRAHFDFLQGSAKLLKEIPATELKGKVPATTIPLFERGGLSVRDNNLIVDFSNLFSIKIQGQTLSDADEMLLYDASHGELRKTTLKTLYHEYINSHIQHPGGGANNIQFRQGRSFGGSSNLTFDGGKNRLTLNGHMETTSIEVHETLHAKAAMTCGGSVSAPIKTITESTYTVEPNDYTILADLSDVNITVCLPDPSVNEGRLLNIKTINTQKYILKSNTLTIKSTCGKIDLFDEITLKMNTSGRVLQSDGKNWWIIGTKGT